MKVSNLICASILLSCVGCAGSGGGEKNDTRAAVPEVRPEEGKSEVFICNGLPIRKMLLEDNEYNRRYKLPGPMKVKYVTIHNTANVGPAINERNYLNKRDDKVPLSFHFAVDENEAIQIMPLNIHGWHAGDGHGEGNMNSIGVEICRSLRYDDDLYMRSEANAVKLAAYLLYIHGLSIDDLRKHEDWSGKKCPHRILETDRWDEFRTRVANSLANLKKNAK